jgi:hypothetical protein
MPFESTVTSESWDLIERRQLVVAFDRQVPTLPPEIRVTWQPFALNLSYRRNHTQEAWQVQNVGLRVHNVLKSGEVGQRTDVLWYGAVTAFSLTSGSSFDRARWDRNYARLLSTRDEIPSYVNDLVIAHWPDEDKNIVRGYEILPLIRTRSVHQ